MYYPTVPPAMMFDDLLKDNFSYFKSASGQNLVSWPIYSH